MDRIRIDPDGVQDVADGDGTSRGRVMTRLSEGGLDFLTTIDKDRLSHDTCLYS